MRGRWSLAIVGVVLILAGGLLAHFTQTADGIRIEDVRFKGAKGNTMSALLYIPANATPQIPAPGILAVHGYINSRVAKFDKDGNWVKSWGEPGDQPGQFHTPHSIAADAAGNIYVADRGNSRIQVFDLP